MGRLIKRFSKASAGATAIEYGLIAALLSMVVAGAVIGLGDHLYNILNTVTNTLNSH